MNIIDTLKALHKGTHSIQMWAPSNSNPDIWICQDGKRYPDNSFYYVMPVEMSEHDLELTSEELTAAVLESTHPESGLYFFSTLDTDDRLYVMDIVEAILNKEWVPSGMESDKTLQAMGYEPHLACIARTIHYFGTKHGETK